MTDRTHPDSGRTTGGIVEILHTRIAELEAQLESNGAGGVSGPLMGQPQAMPDLTALTERGAKAWAGVDAQDLREGGASPSANAGEPSGHIKEPYTLAEIKAKIARAPEALRLAEEITELMCSNEAAAKTIAAAADELCRLHVENASLRAALAASPTPPASKEANHD